MKGSNFLFDYVDALFYKYHMIRLNRGGSYTHSPEWIKNKKATTNPKHNDMCSKYEVTIALNHDNTGKNPERLTRNKPFIGQYEWKEIKQNNCLMFCFHETIRKI